MGIIIFIIVLSVLVVVHELGHFLAAKKAGVRVDEFGLGFPPRLFRLFRKWNTDFTLNAIPFGGFVKIFGENYDSDNLPKSDLGGKHFTQVSRFWQVAILAAGVTFNFLFAWLLFAAGFLIGMPYSTDNDLGAHVSEPKLTIVAVLPESPAFVAGLKTGDAIISISRNGEIISKVDTESVSKFISESSGEIMVSVDRGGETRSFEILPSENVVNGRFAIGISMDMVGTLRLPPHRAIWEGGKVTVLMLKETARGLGTLVVDAVRGRADLSQVTGPVGIVGIVGDASALGLVYVITLTAFISINLAIINLIPIPSLDGGRILFVMIEALRGTPVSPRVFNAINGVSFALLILLMIVITIRDVGNLF